MTTPQATPPLRRPGRTSGSMNLGIALAVLAVLLPLLLNAATGAPPTAAVPFEVGAWCMPASNTGRAQLSCNSPG